MRILPVTSSKIYFLELLQGSESQNDNITSPSHCTNSQHVILLSLSQGTMIRCVPSRLTRTEMCCVTCWHREYHNYCSDEAEHSGFHSWQGKKCLPSPQRADRFWYPFSGKLSMGIKRAEREAYRSPVSEIRCEAEQMFSFLGCMYQCPAEQVPPSTWRSGSTTDVSTYPAFFHADRVHLIVAVFNAIGVFTHQR